jgi:hypothetical protein
MLLRHWARTTPRFRMRACQMAWLRLPSERSLLGIGQKVGAGRQKTYPVRGAAWTFQLRWWLQRRMLARVRRSKLPAKVQRPKKRLQLQRQQLLFNRISLIPQTSTDRLPLVELWGILPVESRKNGLLIRGIIWWNYLVESSPPPTHPAPPADAIPRALRPPAPPPAGGGRAACELDPACCRLTDENG